MPLQGARNGCRSPGLALVIRQEDRAITDLDSTLPKACLAHLKFRAAGQVSICCVTSPLYSRNRSTSRHLSDMDATSPVQHINRVSSAASMHRLAPTDKTHRILGKMESWFSLATRHLLHLPLGARQVWLLPFSGGWLPRRDHWNSFKGLSRTPGHENTTPQNLAHEKLVGWAFN